MGIILSSYRYHRGRGERASSGRKAGVMYNWEDRVEAVPVGGEMGVLPVPQSVEYLQSTVVAARDSSRGCDQFSPKDMPFMPVQLGDGYW